MRLAGVLGGGRPSPRVRVAALAAVVSSRTIPEISQTVLIVDDHAGFRSSARRMLEAAGFEVLGEADTGERGIAAARELVPDLVLLDLQLPGIDGLEVAARLTSGRRAPAVVLTSTRDGAELGSLVKRSGARGFIPKQELSGPAIAELLE